MSSILVVEAEETITRFLKQSLEINEYQTVMILNGEDAVQFALREVPPLIIIDFMHPGVDGCALLQRLREHPKSTHIPIIAINACSNPTEKIHALESGADSCMAYPLDKRELLAHVHRQLQRIKQTSLSPLTRLPSGLQLEYAIHYRLDSHEPWSILYVDLDNFKAFNDVYGFLAGNNIILLVSHICQEVVYEYGNADDLVGHIGGDDFLIITTPDRATILYRQILERYKRESTTIYRPEDLERGSISGVDRKGRSYQFPLVSLSIGIVSDQMRSPHSIDEIGTLAAEAKRHAKLSSNNVFHISSQRNKPIHNHSHANPPFTPIWKLHHFGQSLFQHIEEDALAEFK
jgi:diguanylate cyclase (GGDEF)-like protein